MKQMFDKEIRNNFTDHKMNRDSRFYTQTFQNGANYMLDQIRKSLENYPNGGGDIVIMQEVARICEEYYQKKYHQTKAAAARNQDKYSAPHSATLRTRKGVMPRKG